MLRKMVVGPYQANCYILGHKKTRQGLVIDPGDDVLRIVKEITRSDLSIRYILITHGHIDHVGGAAQLKKITRAPVFIHSADSGGLGFTPDNHLADGQEIQLGDYKITVFSRSPLHATEKQFS